MLKQGLVQGTHGWDVSIMARYYTPDHPAYMVHTDGYPERAVVIGVLQAFTGSAGFFPTDYTLARHILERDFPHLAEGLSRKDNVEEGELRNRSHFHQFCQNLRAIKRGIKWKKESARSTIQGSEPIEVDAELLKPGITGVDPDLPLFDGLSTNPADHLIDLDTDSMERCPDVRVYFWTIGQMVEGQRLYDFKEADIERPVDPELLLEYDNKLVRSGREYLKESRTKKEG
jgi:hypothetical protein